MNVRFTQRDDIPSINFLKGMAKKGKKRKNRTKQSAREKAPVVENKPSWWDSRPSYFQHGVCLAILTLVSLAFFGPIHFSSKSLIAGDTVHWRSMAQSMLDFEEASGEEALWSTNAFGGMPGYMISPPNEVPQLDWIPQSLRSLLWPSSHFLVLLFGVYFLVFYLTKLKWGGVLAACAFGLTSYIPIFLSAGHNSKLIAIAFVPWLILAFVYALRKPGLLSGLLFAAALACNLKAGHVQITYYASFILGIWWIAEGVQAFRSNQSVPFLKSTGMLALGSILGLMMVAQPYISHAVYKDFTIRGAGVGGAETGMAWDYAMGWSQGIGELITLAIADAYGGAAMYWGPKTFTGGPHYIGGIIILLAILGLWRVRRLEVRALGIALLFTILFSLGENASFINRLFFDYFPLFSSFRVPETWLIATVLILVLLAMYGVQYLVSTDENQNGEVTRSFYYVFGAGVGLMLILIVAHSSFFDFEKPGEINRVASQIAQANNLPPDNQQVQARAREVLVDIREEREGLFSGDAMRTMLFILLAGGLIILFLRGRLASPLLLAGLALLVTIDLWGVDRRYFNEDILVDAENSAERVPLYDFDQFILNQVEEKGGPGQFRVLSLEGHPNVTARPAFHYQSLGGYHGAKLRVYQDYLDQLLFDPRTGLPGRNALNLMNVRYVVSPRPIEGYREVHTSQQTGYKVYENPNVAPRAYLVGSAEFHDTASEVLEKMASSSDYDPAVEALVVGEEVAVTPIDSTSTTSVNITAYDAHQIDMQVRTDATRMLVLSEVYYPAGWNAYIDGESVPVLQTNYIQRGIQVPAGDHEVSFRFEPASARLERLLSWLGTLLTYGGILALLALSRIRKTEPEVA